MTLCWQRFPPHAWGQIQAHVFHLSTAQLRQLLKWTLDAQASFPPFWHWWFPHCWSQGFLMFLPSESFLRVVRAWSWAKINSVNFSPRALNYQRAPNTKETSGVNSTLQVEEHKTDPPKETQEKCLGLYLPALVLHSSCPSSESYISF